jgi:hypothetical protein
MTELLGKKILMVFAHPDDEVVAGWPLFQLGGLHKSLLICSSDLNNPERAWCKRRKFVTEQICADRGIEFRCLDYDSEFYRLETRKGSFSRCCAEIEAAVRKFDFDAVFTHNPWGEYGHIDHMMVHHVVMSMGVPVVMTDMMVPSNWVPWKTPSPTVRNAYFRKRILDAEIDMKLYRRIEQLYREQNVWTWSKPPVDKCGVYWHE